MPKKKPSDPYFELLNQISDQVQISTVAIAALDKKVDLHIQRTELELKSINKLDERQNDLLAEHIAGVNTLKAIFENHDKIDQERFDRLETPQKFLSLGWKVSLSFLGACSGIYYLCRLLGILH